MVENFLAVDYGASRIGLALGDSQVKIGVPLEALTNNEAAIEQIVKLANLENVRQIVVGYPRNQAGEATQQTAVVTEFADKLKVKFADVVFQDESLTSVLAEDRLKSYGKKYTKGDIDSMAAVIILEDFLEENYGR